MKYLHITQEHINKATKAVISDHYNCDIDCPVMLAAREQVAPGWAGAFSFLNEFATREGKRIGGNFIAAFDRRSPVGPIDIPLKIRRKEKK